MQIVMRVVLTSLLLIKFLPVKVTKLLGYTAKRPIQTDFCRLKQKKDVTFQETLQVKLAQTSFTDAILDGAR